jgi:hypothetical protein
VVLAVVRFHKDLWGEGVGPGTVLDIEVSEPAAKHSLTLRQVERWLAEASNTPKPQSDAGAGDEGDAVGESKLPSAGLNGQLVLHDVVAFGPSPRAGDNEPVSLPRCGEHCRGLRVLRTGTVRDCRPPLPPCVAALLISSKRLGKNIGAMTEIETAFEGELRQFSTKIERLGAYLSAASQALHDKPDELRFMLDTTVVMTMAFIDHYLTSVVRGGAFIRESAVRRYLTANGNDRAEQCPVKELRQLMVQRVSLLQKNGRRLASTF